MRIPSTRIDQGQGRAALLDLSQPHVLLDKRRSEEEWQVATFGMLGRRDQDGETIVNYLTTHFGK